MFGSQQDRLLPPNPAFRRLANCLIWLPALGLAAAIGLLVAWLAGQPGIWLAVPEPRGSSWLSWYAAVAVFQLIRRNRRAAALDSSDQPGVRRPAHSFPGRRYISPAAGLTLLLILILSALLVQADVRHDLAVILELALPAGPDSF